MIDWSMLGIDATTELLDIKRAYAKKVKEYHPEDDPEGFQHLREAYEAALKWVTYTDCKPERINLESINTEENMSEPLCRREYSDNKNTQDVINPKDQFIFKFMESIRMLCQNAWHRNNKVEWEKLLEDEMLVRLEIKQELYYHMSAFLQENHDIPYEIIVLLNEVFRWTDEPDELWDIFLNEEEIIALAKEGNHYATRLRAATIFFRRAIGLQKAKRLERALRYYEEAEEMIGSYQDKEAQVLLIKIMYNTGSAFGDYGQYEKAIGIYNHLLSTLGPNEDVTMSRYRANALLYKSRMLGYLQKYNEALTTYWKLICTYRKSQDSQINKIVRVAKQEIRKEIRIDVLVLIILYGFLFVTKPQVFIYYFPVMIALLGFVYTMKRR